MTMAEVCTAFGVGQSTASAKARIIPHALHTNRMDPTWMLKRIVDQNPLVWMAEINGLLVDVRVTEPKSHQRPTLDYWTFRRISAKDRVWWIWSPRLSQGRQGTQRPGQHH